MTEIPHEYTVAAKATVGVAPVPDAWYVWFVAQIREHGYQETFGGRTYTYLDVDGWKYWSLPGSDGVTIINRSRLATSSVDVIDVTFDFRSDTPGYRPSRSGRFQSNAQEVSPAPVEQAVAEWHAIRARRHHSGRVSTPSLRARRVLVVERCGDSDLVEVSGG